MAKPVRNRPEFKVVIKKQPIPKHHRKAFIEMVEKSKYPAKLKQVEKHNG